MKNKTKSVNDIIGKICPKCRKGKLIGMRILKCNNCNYKEELLGLNKFINQ